MEDQHVPPLPILLWSSSCFGWFSKMKSIIMRIKSRIGYEFGYFGPWSNLPSVIGLSHILIFSWIMCFKLNSFRLPSQHNFWHTSLFRWTHLSFKIILNCPWSNPGWQQWGILQDIWILQVSHFRPSDQQKRQRQAQTYKNLNNSGHLIQMSTNTFRPSHFLFPISLFASIGQKQVEGIVLCPEASSHFWETSEKPEVIFKWKIGTTTVRSSNCEAQRRRCCNIIGIQ